MTASLNYPYPYLIYKDHFMTISDEPHSSLDKSWRSVAKEDQERKLEKHKLEQEAGSNLDKKSSSLDKLTAREQAVKEQGWRGAQGSNLSLETQDLNPSQTEETNWRNYRLSEENKILREQEQQERMAQKSAKRARKAEQAIASWEKQKRHRLKSNSSKTLSTPTPNNSKHRSQQNHRTTRAPRKDLRSDYHSQNTSSSPVSQPNLKEDSALHSKPKPSLGSQPRTQQEYTETESESLPRKNKYNKTKKVKKRPAISESWIKNAGLKYLGRFSASEQHFRYTMLQKIRNAESRESEDPLVHQQWIEAAVKLAKEYGFLDDQKYANALASSLKRRGLAKSAARQKLRQKKLSTPHINEALTQSYMQNDEMKVDPNLFAAARAAKKKRLGPWGPKNIDYPTLQKQLAKLARRGFSYGIAKQVLQADLEEAEQWLLDGDL